MNVWFAIPSIRPAAEAEPLLALWRERGYKIALLRQGEEIPCDLHIPTDHYQGWAASVNLLCRRIIEMDEEADWIVTGGDDYLPELNGEARDIGHSCFQHFLGTFGVMQPTGDRWGEDPTQPNVSLRGAYIDRICGSPWLGRAFCQRMYGGKGPMFDGYFHMYADEELQCVAQKLDVLWQRRDLTQKHEHALRGRAGLPDFLKAPYDNYAQAKLLFERRRELAFPGHEPVAQLRRMW